MRAFSYAWLLPVTWHCDKDGGHTSRSVIGEKPMLHAKLHGCVCYRTGVIAELSFTLREKGFWAFFVPVHNLDRDPRIFIYEFGACPLEVYTPCANMNFLRQMFPKSSSDRHNYDNDTMTYGTGSLGWQCISNCHFISWPPAKQHDT